MRKTLLFLLLILLPLSSFAQSLTVTWDDNSDNEQGFRCERQSGSGSFSQVCEVGANVKTWTDTAVTLGVPYCYRLRSYNTAGASSPSNTVCKTLTAGAPDAVLNLTCTIVPEVALTGLVLAMSFNEGSGTIVRDTAGINNGEISGALWTNGGKYGNALSFDGINDMVTIPDSDSLDLTAGMTLEAWIYPTAPPGWRTVLFKEQPRNLAYSLYASDGKRPTTASFIGTAKRYLSGPTALPLNAWVFLTATYDGSQYRLYVDGVQVANSAATGLILTSSGALKIGGNAIWGEWFKGKIDNVRMYNQALTPEQIQSDMATPIP